MARGTDFYFKLTHETLWPLKTQFEPVLVFVALPLLSHTPNFILRMQLLDQLEWLLLSERVQEAHQSWFRSCLCELWDQARELSSM